MSHRYEFTMNHEDGTQVILRGNKESLDDLLEDFRDWLKGCTFSASLVEEINNYNPERKK